MQAQGKEGAWSSLKQLASGFLLVTAWSLLPFAWLSIASYLSGIPQCHDDQGGRLWSEHLSGHVNDDYFRRKQLKNPRHTEGEIFDAKEEYAVSDERKEGQVPMRYRWWSYLVGMPSAQGRAGQLCTGASTRRVSKRKSPRSAAAVQPSSNALSQASH